MPKTADQFSPGDEVPGTTYGDSSGIGSDAEREDAVGGAGDSAGMPPRDESAFDESDAADEAAEDPYVTPSSPEQA